MPTEDEDLTDLHGWVSRHALERRCALLAEALHDVLDFEDGEVLLRKIEQRGADVGANFIDFAAGWTGAVKAMRQAIEQVVVP